MRATRVRLCRAPSGCGDALRGQRGRARASGLEKMGDDDDPLFSLLSFPRSFFSSAAAFPDSLFSRKMRSYQCHWCRFDAAVDGYAREREREAKGEECAAARAGVFFPISASLFFLSLSLSFNRFACALIKSRCRRCSAARERPRKALRRNERKRQGWNVENSPHFAPSGSAATRPQTEGGGRRGRCSVVCRCKPIGAAARQRKRGRRRGEGRWEASRQWACQCPSLLFVLTFVTLWLSPFCSFSLQCRTKRVKRGTAGARPRGGRLRAKKRGRARGMQRQTYPSSRAPGRRHLRR